MARVAGHALRKIGSTATGSVTVTEGGATQTALVTTRPDDMLYSLPGTTEGGAGTGRSDPEAVLPTLAAPYWYEEDDFLLLGVVRSRATTTNWPRCRLNSGDSWHEIYPVGDDVQQYDGGSWATIEDQNSTLAVEPSTNVRELGLAHTVRDYSHGYPALSGYTFGLNDGDYDDYANPFSFPARPFPTSIEADDIGFDIPSWPAEATDYVRLRWWYDYNFEPPIAWEREGGASDPATGEVDIDWLWEWWVVARVWGPNGCDDWTDTEPADAGESIALLTGPELWFWRAYVTQTDIYVQRRTQPTGTWTTLGHWTGAHPALSQDVSGTVYLVYDDEGSVQRLNVATGSATIVATGSHPREHWAPGHIYRVLTYHDGSDLVADVTDAQNNQMHGGTVTIVASVAAQAFDVRSRPDGTLEGWYADGSNVLTQLTSADNGATWS